VKKRHVPDGYKLVFTSKITVKGKIIYARSYGKTFITYPKGEMYVKVYKKYWKAVVG